MKFDKILIIENQNADRPPDAVVEIFNCDAWIDISFGSEHVQIKSLSSGLATEGIGQLRLPPLKFYEKILSALMPGGVIFRVRCPDYPLHPGLHDEIKDLFPEEDYDYVLSTAEECGLSGYFCERFIRAFFQKILNDPQPLMPPGYWNGMAHSRSVRHWFSLALRRFYLENHFETLFDSPRSVAINAVPGCNYHCLKCQYHSPQLPQPNSKKMQTMTLENFKKIVDLCGEFKRLKVVYPTISGEPLAHPRIVEMVSYVKRKGYAIGFATNGALLTREKSKQLVDAGLDSLVFSVDSVDPQLYQKLQGGDLKSVEGNIMSFKKEARKRNQNIPMTMCCVVSSENEKEIEAYRKKWLEAGLSVIFSAEHDILNNYKPFFAHRRWSPDQRMPCFALWHCLYLNPEGHPISCGAMAKGDEGLQEWIINSPPSQLWRGNGLTRLREQQLTGQTPGYCHDISCWTGMMNTWVYENGRMVCHSQGTWSETTPMGFSKKKFEKMWLPEWLAKQWRFTFKSF